MQGARIVCPAMSISPARVRAHGQYLRIGVEYQSHGRYDTTVPRLILVLRDLYPARLSEAARATLPRLPRLEQWLARGETEPAAGDWRQWLQREVARPRTLAMAPPASIAGAAVAGVPADVPVWLATPCPLGRWARHGARASGRTAAARAARSSACWSGISCAVFAGSGWSLHATGRRELLLAGGSGRSSRMRVRSHDPALWLGADPREGLARGPGCRCAAPTRRRNRDVAPRTSDQRGAAAHAARSAANALWIWGGGAAHGRGTRRSACRRPAALR